MSVMSKYKVMLGSDPELLLKKTINGNTKPFPIIGLIGHGKKDPLHIDDSGFRTLQEDNVALEYTTHPTSTLEDWVEEQSNMYNHAVEIANGFDLEVALGVASLNFNPKMLKSIQASTFGCDATWNAYTNSENPPPSASGNVRSVGGHVHISYENPNDEMSMELTKLLDVLYLENYNTLSGSGEKDRRDLYGKAGEIRLKTYGFEWRVPSSNWVHNKSKIEKIWSIVEEAFKLYDQGFRFNMKYVENIDSKITNGDRNGNRSAFIIKNSVKKAVRTKTKSRKVVSTV